MEWSVLKAGPGAPEVCSPGHDVPGKGSMWFFSAPYIRGCLPPRRSTQKEHAADGHLAQSCPAAGHLLINLL